MSANENVVSSFPTMGDNGMVSSVVNMSGQRSQYTTPGPGIGGGGKSDAPDSDTSIRKSTEIENAQGPKATIYTRIYEGNAAEANLTLRNVRIVPSKAGVSDFWAGGS